VTEIVDRTALTRVEDALDRHLADARARAYQAGPGVVALWDAVVDAAADGKRVRPLLLLDTHAALGGQRPDAALQVAAAFEVLHLAFCAHDDVIDGDVRRRGRPTVWSRYEQAAAAVAAHPEAARSAGLAAGILAGDLLLMLAFRLVATAPLERADDVRAALLDVVDRIVQRTASGELDDVLGPIRPSSVGLPDALTTAAYKTAEYSFVGPVVSAAVLADAPAELVAVLARAARELGTAYQLTDDLLGTFGDERVTGKSVRSDLAEGKVTALVVLARETSAWPLLAAHLGDRDVTDATAAEVRRALERAGVRRRVEELVDSATTAALQLLGEPVVPGAARDVLGRHAAMFEGRLR